MKKKPSPAPDNAIVADAPATIPIHCRYDRLTPVPELFRALHPQNNNRHPPEQLTLLAEIFQHTGIRHSVIVSRRSNLVVAGEGRVRAAALLPDLLPSLPVVDQDFASEAEELAFLSADNRLQELSERDESLTEALIRRIRTSSPAFAILTTGYTEKAIAKLQRKAKGRAERKDIRPSEYGILVIARDEPHQAALHTQLMALGLECKIVCS